MQTLPAGSFLNLESETTVEALKFTARLLAEHSERVIKDDLSAAALENLAKSLWQKAEYVTRETERRRSQQIFVENFIERFREVKPDLSTLPIDSISALLHPPGAEVHINGEKTCLPPIESPAIQQTSETQTRQDEFLGIVKPDEHLIETNEMPDAPVTSTETIVFQNVQAEPVAVSATVPSENKTENETIVADVNVSESEATSRESDLTAEREKTVEISTETAPRPVTEAINEVTKPTETQIKSETQVKSAVQSPTKTEEPFEFGKCTVNLNLVLLPGGSGNIRQAIISAASHNLPPEIELLEIEGFEDLEQIALLVKNKLHRFSLGLPVKYMETLRAAKAKTVKINKSAPKQTGVQQSTEEKSSGSQIPSKADNLQNELTQQPLTTATEGSSMNPELSAKPGQTAATSATTNAQPNLF